MDYNGRKTKRIQTTRHAQRPLGSGGPAGELRGSQVARDGGRVELRHWEERKLFLFGIGTDFRKLKYPFAGYGLLEYLDVLSRVVFLRDDPRLNEVIDLLVAKRDDQG